MAGYPLLDPTTYISDDDRSNVAGEITQADRYVAPVWRPKQYTPTTTAKPTTTATTTPKTDSYEWWKNLSQAEQNKLLASGYSPPKPTTTSDVATPTKPPPTPDVNPINGQPWDPNPPPPPSNYGQQPTPPTNTTFTGPIWQPTGWEEDPMNFDTRAPFPGQVPEFDWYTGDGGPNNVTQWQQSEGNTYTMLNPDGSVTPGVVDPTTRDVMPEELVEERLSNLLRSDSKLIQDARRQGMEQANALGGLGGTVGAGASMQAAMRTALPIAQSDAEAYRAAAAQNMDALNQFAQLNHQRATQLEQSQIDARTRLQTTQITTSAQMAAAMLESATQRDLSRLDSETKLRVQEMVGKIQDRLATNEFKFSALLNDAQYAAELAKTMMQGEYGLAGTGLAGQWDKATQDAANAVQQETRYMESAMGAYSGYMDRLAQLNGMEMDQAARDRAAASITKGFQAQMKMLELLYPNATKIDWGVQ